MVALPVPCMIGCNKTTPDGHSGRWGHVPVRPWRLTPKAVALLSRLGSPAAQALLVDVSLARLCFM